MRHYIHLYSWSVSQYTLWILYSSRTDLTPEARLLYCSESIIDVLGYTPDEVVNRSCWEFFHPDEVPYAKHIHERGVAMDKAALLAYCRVKDKSGQWMSCECCFTIVYDVVVVCTSIYKSTEPSQSMLATKSEQFVVLTWIERARDAPIIRRIFASSPKDPRYHMVTHLSHKFQHPYNDSPNEPRAALFLNRFTRTLTIMYATTGLQDVLGISAEALQGRSFYYCIAENCLQDAIKCLENAKANDSIAYLRFWFRDPSIDDADQSMPDSDEDTTTNLPSVGVTSRVRPNSDSAASDSSSSSSTALRSDNENEVRDNGLDPDSRTSSGESISRSDTHEAIFGTARRYESMSSATSPVPIRRRSREPLELEAVISCASDGLVVCLRQARPSIPSANDSRVPMYQNGFFAAPWAEEPSISALDSPSPCSQSPAFAPSLGPHRARHEPGVSISDSNNFMMAIQEQAIFAWALTGINGSVHKIGTGTPEGDSLPPFGLPIWQSEGIIDQKMLEQRTDSASAVIDPKANSSPVTQRYPGPSTAVFGDPGLAKSKAPNVSMTDR